MTIPAKSTQRSGARQPRRAGPRSGLPRYRRRRPIARVVIALMALGSLVAPGVAAVVAAVL